MKVKIVEGDLLNQEVEVIVNAWNRNIIPWWLLIPQGVSGAIKKKGGYEPFWELGWMGPIPLGGAVQTTAGRLSYKAIIHVAGINMMWRSSEFAITNSVVNAMETAEKLGVKSIAFPVIGSGSGGFKEKEAEEIMLKTFEAMESDIEVIVVRYKKDWR